MDVSYRGIVLDIVDHEGTYRRAQYTDDGADYLYTTWHVELLITMNPATATAVLLTQGLGGVGQNVIDANIRHPLMQPRGTLILAMNGEPILITPAPGDLTDAANGPTPISFDILKVVGDKTFICKYVIEARVNECKVPSAQNGQDTRPIILAHRWTETADTDEDYFTTRTITGKVTFRSDALLRQNRAPDMFRAALSHPIPANMKRDGIQVTQESDGVTFNYTFTDSEKPFNWYPASNIGYTRVEAYETQFEQCPEPFAWGIDVLRGGLPAMAWAGVMAEAAGARMGLGLNPLAWGIHDVEGIVRAISSRYNQHVFVRVWGHRASIRPNLQALALSVLYGRLNPPAAIRPANWVSIAANLLTGMEFSMTHDLAGKFVEISATYKRGPASGALLGNAAINFPASDLLYNGRDAGGGAAGTQLTTANPSVAQVGPPPNDLGARGTHLTFLIAQALTAPCTPPAYPGQWWAPTKIKRGLTGLGQPPMLDPDDPDAWIPDRINTDPVQGPGDNIFPANPGGN